MERKAGWVLLVCVVAMTVAGAASVAWAQPAAAPEAARSDSFKQAAIVVAVALSVGLACLGAGIAVGRVGAAALGAASERPELLFKSLILVALAEGIAIYGFVIAIWLLTLLPK